MDIIKLRDNRFRDNALCFKRADDQEDYYISSSKDEDEGLDEDAMVTEITNNILDGEKPKPEDDKDEKVRNKKLNTSPFKSKNFG